MALRRVYPLGTELLVDAGSKVGDDRNQFWMIADLPDVSVSVMDGAVIVVVDDGEAVVDLFLPPIGDDVLLPVNTAADTASLPDHLPDVWFVAVAIP